MDINTMEDKMLQLITGIKNGKYDDVYDELNCIPVIKEIETLTVVISKLLTFYHFYNEDNVWVRISDKCHAVLNLNSFVLKIYKYNSLTDYIDLKNILKLKEIKDKEEIVNLILEKTPITNKEFTEYLVNNSNLIKIVNKNSCDEIVLDLTKSNTLTLNIDNRTLNYYVFPKVPIENIEMKFTINSSIEKGSKDV